MRLLILLQSLALVGISFWLWTMQHNLPRLAVVRIPYVLEKAKAMKEANALLGNKRELIQLRMDSLEKEAQVAYHQMQKNQQSGKDLSINQELKAKIEMLATSRNQLKESITRLEETYTQGALNQINARIGEFAKKKGLDLVLGGNYEGSILFGSDRLDITENLILFLNE